MTDTGPVWEQDSLHPIEAQVLAGYKAVNPSKMEMTRDGFEALCERRARLFVTRLHLPPALFRGAKVLDLGCGTGEHAAVYARWGATVHGVDFNEFALAELRSFVAQHGLADRVTGEQASLSSWVSSGPVYDIAVADGVIHHIPDPQAAVGLLAASTRVGGVVVFSTAPLPGAEQRALMRRIVRRFAPNLKRAVQLVSELFPEYLERATRMGRRTPEQVVSDNFLTVQNDPLSVRDVLGQLDSNDVLLYRSWPPLELPIADPASAPPLPLERSPWRELLVAQAAAWSSQRYLAGEEQDPFELRGEWWREEFEALAAALEHAEERALTELRRIIPSCRVFGRGTCGVGEWWVVGVKRGSAESEVAGC